MAFREKIAWVTLAGIVAGFALYFGSLAAALAEGRYDSGRFIGLLVILVFAEVMLSVVAAIVIAVRAPADAQAPRDERDQLIGRRAAGISYYILLVGVFLAAAPMHLGLGRLFVLNGLLAAIMIAEAARHAIQIASYRRGY